VRGAFTPTRRAVFASPQRTQDHDAIAADFPLSEAIAPRIEAFEAYLDSQLPTTAAAEHDGDLD